MKPDPFEYKGLKEKYRNKLQYNFPQELFSDRVAQDYSEIPPGDVEEKCETDESELSISIEYIKESSPGGHAHF